MKAILVAILSLVLIVPVAFAAAWQIPQRGCVTADIDSTGDDFWVNVGGFPVSIQLEADTAGANVGVSVDVYACSDDESAGLTSTSCGAFQWDSTGDGLLNTNTLDGVTSGQRGLERVGIAGFLFFDITAISAGSAESSLKVCTV